MISSPVLAFRKFSLMSQTHFPLMAHGVFSHSIIACHVAGTGGAGVPLSLLGPSPLDKVREGHLLAEKACSLFVIVIRTWQ